LRIGEDAVITLKLAGPADSAWPPVQIESTAALDATLGPVSILSQRAICWKIVPREPGYHQLIFDVGGQRIEKELAVGDGYMRVSLKRPALDLSAGLLHPWERPFGLRSPVSEIEIEYPTRSSWTSGSNSWLVYWFVASMLGALAFRRVLKVNL
jgi:hypothetical protein